MNREVNGFLRSEGRKLVNGDGRDIVLRGVGFGSWMLPEGYMWRFPDGGDRPRRIKRMVRDLIGEQKASLFWRTYYDRYINEPDIRKIAEEGFNSVRVPIHAWFLMEEAEPYRDVDEHWRLLDRVIGWCRDYGLYAILDLHGAPGGQTGTNIDDSENDKPELFTDERYSRLTVDLWRKLAERYRDEWIVAGYDLLNEPLPDWFAEYNDRVMPLYRDIVAAIREVDQRHMIILEGVHWATDWSIFGEPIDGNLMLQFHKYWNNPDTESIRKFLDARDKWNVPIYMGEGGENNKDWYAGAFRMFEDHGVSWNFWTWKKMDTDNSPCSVRKPEGWSALVAYLEGREKPDAASAERTLWEYLENLAFDECDYHPEVAEALFRRPNVRIPAVFYGYRGEGVGYGFGDSGAGYRVANKRGAGNLAAGFRSGDGTEIRFVAGDRTEPNFQHGRGEAWRKDEWLCVCLEEGDWTAYEFELAEESAIDAAFHMSVPDITGRLAICMDGSEAGSAETGGEGWQTVRILSAVRLGPGSHRIIAKAEGGPVLLQWLEIRKSKSE